MLRPVPEPDEPQRASCPLGVCDGSGWILRDDDLTEPCECRERMIGRAISRGMGTGVPKRFRGVSFDRRPICDLDPSILRPVRDYLRSLPAQLERGRGLWFYGEVGTGKSSLAMLVAQQALQDGFSVAVYSVPRLLSELRSTFDEHSTAGGFMRLFERLAGVDLLLLDDLGAERQTEWVMEQLYAVVNERWQDRKAIIVTSNFAAADTQSARFRGLIGELERDIASLRRARERDSGGSEIGRSIERLEALGKQLSEAASEASETFGDPLEALRHQIGRRTVSRLIEICDDPLPIMGPDLRVSAG